MPGAVMLIKSLILLHEPLQALCDSHNWNCKIYGANFVILTECFTSWWMMQSDCTLG